MTTGRIRDTDLEEVRRRASLPEVAADYMHLRKAGRLFKALCAFHAEKTPSLSIDPAKGLYYCHGCGEGGDVFNLVMKLESLSFAEAVERLARRVGVELRYERVSASERAAHRKRLRLVDANREAAAFYHRTLMGPDGADARTYLKSRDFTRETAQTFEIGLAPRATDELRAHLRTAGFSDDELLEAGLVLRRDDGQVADRFRTRLMFPIADVTGNHVGFGGRRLTDDAPGPKYVNSPESPIYRKGQILYALDRAKGDVVKAGFALVVEGYTDVIALHQAGITNVVATCGTALGLEHLRSVQRFSQEVALSLDSDDAGGRAAERTYEQLIGDAQQMGLALKVVLMSPGEDPADAVERVGAEGFAGLVTAAVPLLEFVLKREADRYGVGDPEVRARALAAGLRIIAKTENEVVRNEYARRLSGWIKVDPHTLHVELDKVLRGGAPSAVTGSVMKRSSAEARREREALKLALQHPHLVKEHIDDLEPEAFSVPAYRAVWRALAQGCDPSALGDVLDEEATRAYTELSVEATAGEANERLAADIFGRLKESVVSRQIDELKTRLQRLNPTTHPDEHDRLFADLVGLERRKRALQDEDR